MAVNLQRNVLYSGLLSSTNYIFPLIVYPYVSRVLGVHNIGIYNFVDSIINYFTLFSMLGISIVGIREIAVAKVDRNQLDKTFSGLLIINVIATIVSLVILGLSILALPELWQYRKMLGIGALKLLGNALLMEWFFFGMENFKYVAMRSVMVRLLYIVAVFTFVRDMDDYDTYYLLFVIMTLANAVINMTYIRHFVSFRFRGARVTYYLKPMLMMGLYAILTKVYITFNTAYLGFVAGETEVGYFSTATKLYSVLMSLFAAFTGVMMPRMSSLLSEGKGNEYLSLMNKSLQVLFVFVIPIIIVSVVFASDIVLIISGSGYEGAVLPMQLCMPLMLVIGYEQLLIHQGLMPLKKDKAVLFNSVIGAFVGVILCVTLLAPYKSVGAAIVWAVSELIVLISAHYMLNRVVVFRFPLLSFLRYLAYNIPLLVVLLTLARCELGCYVNMVVASLLTAIYTLVLHYWILKNSMVMDSVHKICKMFNNLRQ